MPPSPKLVNTFRMIWSVKIIHEFKPHYLCCTYCHIRIAREITKYLKRKKYSGDDKA